MRGDYQYDLFISFYHENEPKVNPIYDELTGLGLRVFWSPKTLEHGQSFPPLLGEAVTNSQHFLVYWSDAAKTSKWVSKECTIFQKCHMADEEHRRMYVLLDGDCEPESLPPTLQDLNCSNSTQGLVKDIVRTLLKGLTDESEAADTRHKDQVLKLQEHLKQEKAQLEDRLIQEKQELEERLRQEERKLKEAQKYYRHNRFWGRFSEHGEVHIFTCARDVPYNEANMRGTMRGLGGRTNIDMWDYRAVMDITHFFASNYPNAKVKIQDPVSKMHDQDLQEPVNLAYRISTMDGMLEDKDCIIIGSPDVSDFAELVLAKIHKFEPYAKGRVKKKGFVTIKDTKFGRSSSYWEKENRPGEQEGIAQIHPNHNDYYPHVFSHEDGPPGKMHGILIVANNPFCKDKDRRKIIILSGFSGVATDAIAKLLTDNKCFDEFLKLDNAYVDMNRDVEVLVGVEYVTHPGYESRDRRQIVLHEDLPGEPYAITFEKLVEI